MYRLNSTPGRAFSTLFLCVVSLGFFLSIPLLGIEPPDIAGDVGLRIDPFLRIIWFIGMATSLACSLKCSMSFLMNDEFLHMIPYYIRTCAVTFPLIMLWSMGILEVLNRSEFGYLAASILVLVGCSALYFGQYRIEYYLLAKHFSEFPTLKIRFFCRMVNSSVIPVYLMFALLAMDVLVSGGY